MRRRDHRAVNGTGVPSSAVQAGRQAVLGLHYSLTWALSFLLSSVSFNCLLSLALFLVLYPFLSPHSSLTLLHLASFLLTSPFSSVCWGPLFSCGDLAQLQRGGLQGWSVCWVLRYLEHVSPRDLSLELGSFCSKRTIQHKQASSLCLVEGRFLYAVPYSGVNTLPF